MEPLESEKPPVPLKPLSATESSILAIIAENPEMSPKEFDEITAGTSPDTKEIAKAIVELAQKGSFENDENPTEVVETAKDILGWVRINRRFRPIRASSF